MKRRSFVSCILILLLWSASSAQTPANTATELPLRRLENEIARLAKAAGGTLGVSATHVESGRSVSFNGTERFPMASTYKIPIAVQLLYRVDRGDVRLD